MRTYKGFNKDMTCREFQYEEGKEYEGKKKPLHVKRDSMHVSIHWIVFHIIALIILFFMK